MNAPIVRPSNVAGMLLAGRYWYTDTLGAEPVHVDVAWEDGECIVRFLPVGDDLGAEVPLKDMAACDRWPEHFERVR